MDIVIDAAWVSGMLLATIRIAAFVVASPIFGSAIPTTGRVALVLVLGFAFADPVAGTLDLGVLLAAGLTNAIIGLALGFLTGLIFYVFTVAGNLIDFTSSLSAASVFDPLSRSRTAIYGRFFNLSAVTLFFVLGGDRMLVGGLGSTFEVVGVTGSVDLSPGLGATAIVLMGRLMIAAVELAMPALAALFVVELVLGIAARFAPQSNVFLIGLPAKVLAAFATVGAVLLLVPETMAGVLDIVQGTFRDVMASFHVG